MRRSPPRPPCPAAIAIEKGSRACRQRPGRPRLHRHLARPGRSGGDPPLEPAAVRDGAAHGDRPPRPGEQADHRLQGRRHRRVLGPRPHARLPADARRADVRGGRAALELLLQGKSTCNDEGFIAFGGMEDVRFRGQVRPGRPARARRQGRCGCIAGIPSSSARGSSGTNMVFHGKIIGVPISGQDEAPGRAERPDAAVRPRPCRRLSP